MVYSDATRHRRSITNHDYFITVCVAGRKPVFDDFSVARQLVNVFRLVEQDGRLMFKCWVVMPDHFHLLVTLVDNSSLATAIGFLKSTATRRMPVSLGWQNGFYERCLRTDDDRLRIARYIVMNPVRAGLVNSVRDYPHWDSNYF